MNLKNGMLLILLLAPKPAYSNDDDTCTQALVATGVVTFSLGFSLAGMLFYYFEQRRINHIMHTMHQALTALINQNQGQNPPPYSPAAPANLHQPTHRAIEIPPSTAADPATLAAANALISANRSRNSPTQSRRAFGNFNNIPADE